MKGPKYFSYLYSTVPFVLCFLCITRKGQIVALVPEFSFNITNEIVVDILLRALNILLWRPTIKTISNHFASYANTTCSTLINLYLVDDKKFLMNAYILW